jgi:hypothetical protein
MTRSTAVAVARLKNASMAAPTRSSSAGCVTDTLAYPEAEAAPPLNLLVLAVGHCKVSFERIPSLFCRKYAIPTAARTVEYSSCKDLGVISLELLCLTDGDPPPLLLRNQCNPGSA